MGGGVLTVAEIKQGHLAPVSLELFEVGRKLAEKMGAELSAAVLGCGIKAIAGEVARFVDRVYEVDSPALEEFHADVYAEVIYQICVEVNPDVILLGHTIRGADVAPRLAFKLRVQLTTDCTDLEWDGEKKMLRRIKPVYGGNAVAVFEPSGRPQFVTVRPKVWERAKPSPSLGQVIPFEPSGDLRPKTELVGTVREETPRLGEADIVISGGRGVKGPRGFKMLRELSELLAHFGEKSAVGATRPPCDLGWVPKTYQIGLTGEKVCPKLYVAVGISGSVQHLAGIVRAKTIVAINVDPEAHIFKVADYGVIGEYERVLPAFMNKLREMV